MGNWRKSSYSGANGGQCVEVASHDQAVAVRDTTDRDGTALAFTPGAWAKFTASLKCTALRRGVPGSRGRLSWWTAAGRAG